MPTIYGPMDSSPAPTMSSQFAAPTSQGMQQATDLTHPDSLGLGSTLAGAAAFAVPDLVDTVSSSLGITQRGQINDTLMNALDMPGLKTYHDQVQGATSVASGVLGLVGAEFAAGKIIANGTKFARALSSMPIVSRAVALDEQYQTAMNTVRAVDMGLAKSGALGGEQFVGKFALDDGLLARNTAVRSAKLLNVAQGVRQGALVQGISALTMNSNDSIYTDSAAWNTTFAAAGIAIPGGLNWLNTGYALRKAASEANLIKAQIGALDPGGMEAKRLLWRTGTEDAGEKLLPFGGRVTDNVTSLLLEGQSLRAGEITDGADARMLMANRDKLRTQNLQMAREQLNSVTVKGLSNDGRTRFNLGSSDDSRTVSGALGYSNHISEIMNRDPSAFYLVEQMGGVPNELSATQVAESWQNRIAERKIETEKSLLDPKIEPDAKRDLRKLRLQLQEEGSQTPFVFIDGERQPMSEAAVMDNFEAPKESDYGFVKDANQPLDRKPKGPIGIWSLSRPESQTTVGVIDNNLAVTIPGGKNIQDLDHYDALRMYRLGNKAVDSLAKSGEDIILGPKPNWFQLDMAENILQKNPSASIMFPDGLTRESAQVESYAQKAEILRDKAHVRMFKYSAGNTVLDPESEMARLRVKLNLPRMTAYEMGVRGSSQSPVLSLLQGAEDYSPDAIRKMSLTDVKQAVAEYSKLGDKVPVTATDIKSLTGNSFTYMLDSNGVEMKPIVGTYRPAQRVEWMPDQISDRIAARQSVQRNLLLSDRADPLTKILAQFMQDSPDAQQAAMTHEIRDTQMQGAITGSKPNSFFGAASNAISTSEFASRDAPTILAAGRLRDTIDRLTGNLTTKMFGETFEGTLSQLANPRNAQSTLLLDQFHSAASGWDILPKAIKQDGFNAFKLAETEANKQRYLTQFGKEMPVGANLVGPSGRTVVLDDLAMDVQTRYNKLTQARLDAQNTLLRSQGMQEIAQKPWYVSSQKTQGKFIGYTRGPDNKPIPGMGIVADTQTEYDRKMAAMQPQLDKLGLGYSVVSLKDTQEYGSIWDRAMADMIDPGTTAIASGKVAKGLNQEQWVRNGAFANALVDLRNGFQQHGRDLIQTQYDASIKAAMARSRISSAAQPNAGGLFKSNDFKNAHDIYLENLTGRSKVYDPKSLLGGIYNGVEGTIDKFFQSVAPTASNVTNAMNAWFRRVNPFSDSQGAQKDFESLKNALGRYMPFDNFAAMAEAKGFGVAPWKAQGLASSYSGFAATVLLRMFETSHMMVNAGGLLAANPAVIRFMAKGAQEDVPSYLARIGHTGLAINVEGRDPIGMIDIAKITKNGIMAALNPKNHELYDDMVSRGMLSQEIAELHKQYGLINGRGPLESFIKGDPSIAHPQGVAEKLKSKGLIGWASVLTDKSEDFSRTVATMTGHELAKAMGVETKEGRLSFAHDFANKIIANYTPANRPEVFQGAIGTSIGLFQSFVQNYYQRLFRYGETKDFQALANQFMGQAAIFGIPSVPGWSTLNALHSSESTDGTDMTGVLRHAMGGGAAADLLQGGLLSNLPSLFGAPAADYYSRGDINPRIVGSQLFAQAPKDSNAAMQIASMSPALSVMMKLEQSLSQAIGGFWANKSHLSGEQIGEILSNTIPNRPISGMIEQLLAGGHDTDSAGQLVADTQNAMESIYRVMGIRSMRQANSIDAYYANKAPMEHKAAADYQLRVASRAAVRDGKFNELYDVFQNQYLQNGGDPRYFRRWVKEQYESALMTRSERQMKSALSNPARSGEVSRLLETGIPLSDPEQERNKLSEFYNSVHYDPNESGGEFEGQMNDPSLSAAPTIQ